MPVVLRDHPITSKLLEKEMRIADMGCGMGKSTHSLASVFQRSTIVGLDLDSNSIKCAKDQNKNEKVEFIEKNMFDVDPNSEEKYDIICFFLCLHDMTWPTEALKITKRMLKPGCIVYLSRDRLQTSSIYHQKILEIHFECVNLKS